MRTQTEEKKKLSKQLVIISGWVAADSLNQESTSSEKQSLQRALDAMEKEKVVCSFLFLSLSLLLL